MAESGGLPDSAMQASGDERATVSSRRWGSRCRAWSVGRSNSTKTLTITIDFKAGSRFAVAGRDGVHPVHDTVVKTYRHLNFFQRECHLQVRTPRVKLPDGKVVVEPEFVGKLAGFTRLFEALILMFARQMPFAAVARIAGESAHRVTAVCTRYVELAVAQTDLSTVTTLAIDETSRARGHDDISRWPMPVGDALCS